MTSPAELEDGERYVRIAQRWFTEGWAGNLVMADDIFSEELRINGDLALPGREGHRDPYASGPVRDPEADRVPTGTVYAA
jgi:hypothetical protein